MVSTARLAALLSDVGSEVVGVLTPLLSTVNASPHVDELEGVGIAVGVGMGAESRVSVDAEAEAEGSTTNGSPQEDVWAEEMPRRERIVVFLIEDRFILLSLRKEVYLEVNVLVFQLLFPSLALQGNGRSFRVVFSSRGYIQRTYGRTINPKMSPCFLKLQTQYSNVWSF